MKVKKVIVQADNELFVHILSADIIFKYKTSSNNNNLLITFIGQWSLVIGGLLRFENIRKDISSIFSYCG